MKTRPTHRECDGQVRELNEDFKNANGEAKAPGQFGIASEDINCRCAVLIKPRWDVDSRFTKRDNETKKLKEFGGVKSYQEFKKRYWKSVDKSGESGIIKIRNSAGKEITPVKHTDLYAEPNSITQYTNSKGGIDRNYYDENGKQIKQISNNDHGKPKAHPFGEHGEHAHDYIYSSEGNLVGRPKRDLTDDERKENNDIL